MNKFKVGDIVIITENLRGYKGKASNIISFNEFGMCNIAVYGWFYPENIELVEIYESPLYKVMCEKED